jgi:hypothetical protein
MNNPIFSRTYFSLLCLCAWSAGQGFASEAVSGAGGGDDVTIILRQTPMPIMEHGRLGEILNRYYKEGVGGSENWENVESLRVAGTLTLAGGEFEFNAYQKKPYYIKMTIYGNRRNLILGYDGETAWQATPDSKGKAVPMSDEDARRFKHSAHFGNHLLYPYALGKKIEYINTVPVEGVICHLIRVTLDSGYQVDYYINIRTYLEVKAVTLDLISGVESSVAYEDYIRESGMPIAQKVVSCEAGAWVSDLVLEEVKVNSGIMPWMFKMPKK